MTSPGDLSVCENCGETVSWELGPTTKRWKWRTSHGTFSCPGNNMGRHVAPEPPSRPTLAELNQEIKDQLARFLFQVWDETPPGEAERMLEDGLVQIIGSPDWYNEGRDRGLFS